MKEIEQRKVLTTLFQNPAWQLAQSRHYGTVFKGINELHKVTPLGKIEPGSQTAPAGLKPMPFHIKVTFL